MIFNLLFFYTQKMVHYAITNVFLQVPREKCVTFEREPREPTCRTKTQTKCRIEPKTKCRNVVTTECQMMPRRKCPGPKTKTEKCSQSCQPVFWCKVCQN